jgi:nicotinate-nucleotide--dimethylbenzimidazole phosphoribosyltransferase
MSELLREELQQKINSKTKPLGALGRLEELAIQIGLALKTSEPKIKQPSLIVFAADHGIAKEGVSAYPQEVTYQMVLNFLKGGAAINVFCQQNQWDLEIVDAGVIGQFEPQKHLIDAKIAHGTKSFLKEPAMTNSDCEKALDFGRSLAQNKVREGSNMLAFGEMGIGNTSSASVLMHLMTDIPLDQCVGRGTGLDEQGRLIKLQTLQKALDLYDQNMKTKEVLATFGGFEIAMICGAFMGAAESGALFLVDGFIASSAYLMALQLDPQISQYAIFSHQSNEQGHKKLLDYLQVKPLLDLDLRLGEGTGCALALPIVHSAVNFLNQMASFESAGVSNKED